MVLVHSTSGNVLIPLFSHFTSAVNIYYDFGMPITVLIVLLLYNNLLHNLVSIWRTGFGIYCSYLCNNFRVIDITIWAFSQSGIIFFSSFGV